MFCSAVLEACDFALPAAEKLLELGMDWKEVLKLIPKATWCHRWLKTLGLMYAAKYENALKVLDSCPIFSGSPEGKALRGKIFVMQGRYEDSITHFEDAIAKKPTHLRHTDTLARMYCMFSSFKLDQMAGELDKITERVRNVAPNSVESYVCLAYRAVVQKRYELAAALAEKALKMDPYGIETALLMRKCIVDPTKLDKAELVLKRARRAHMTCFDIYDQLMDIYTSTERVSAAAALSKEATKAFGVTARTLHLEAIVLRAAAENSDVETDNSLYRRAAALLEKSIDLDFYYVPAYVTLVEIRRELEMEEENMELLENVQVELHANEIYRELGITYVNLDRHLDKAIAAFHRALRLNQFDMVAVSSLRKLQHLSNVTPFTAELRNLLNRIETATREEEEEETAKNQTDEQMSGAENSAADDSQPWSEDMESEQEMSVD
ncbi:unnamed protein product [Notodromas monacha]|uniref:Anaphase promoting complex subunit 7 n=1 Tax=Notodromas monacha TaxID=399045 RepID=A0A7R9GGS7_9CRUS|nr:unnamed protein product [Notodromas monacha]CAG0922038.1 unnamed protein product [Notodromas monacha]